MFVVQVPRECERDTVIRQLGEQGIQSKPYMPAIHLMSFYRERFGHREGEFPVCEDVAARSLALPFFPEMTEGQVTRVAEAARARCGRGRRRGARAAAVHNAGISRFAEPQDRGFRALNDSIAFDWRLSPYDVDQSLAHAGMLAAQGIISEEDRDQIQQGLEQVRRELSDGTFPFAEDDEDIHMAIERRLTQIAGPAGGRLHTARSRNDQVATDMAMFVRAHAHDALARIGNLASTLVEVAERHLDWPMPGYTHLQRAQPVYLSHHLLAYVWMLVRDRERFEGVVRATGKLPLGAGALAGVNFDTDRRAVAGVLGFTGVAENSIDAVVQPRLRARLPGRGRPPVPPIYPAWAPRSSCGPVRSSPSPRSLTRGPRARRSCPRRRILTPPSC